MHKCVMHCSLAGSIAYTKPLPTVHDKDDVKVPYQAVVRQCLSKLDGTILETICMTLRKAPF